MYCSNCGKDIENNSSFCIHCGGKIGQPDIKSKDSSMDIKPNEKEQKRLRYKKYGSYMIFIALVCLFAGMGIRSDGYSSTRGFFGFLMFVFGGAGLIVYFTN